MTNKLQFSRADILVYFTGSADRRREPSPLQEIEKIELYKGFESSVPERRRRDLIALIEQLSRLPSYASAKEVARDFGKGGFFARIGFTSNLTLMVEAGALINPVSSVYGLSPKILLELGLLDKFLGRAHTQTAAEIWQWVRTEFRQIEATQTRLKQAGINVWK